MKKMIFNCGLALSMAAFFTACDKHEHDDKITPAGKTTDKEHKEEAHGKPQHGGQIIEVGEEVAHVEFKHDVATGTMTAWIYGAKIGEALALDNAPKVFVTIDGKNTPLQLKAESGKLPASVFSITAENLKVDFHGHGKFNFTLKGEVYNEQLPHAPHGHH